MSKKNTVVVASIVAALGFIGTGCQITQHKIPGVTISRPRRLPQRPTGRISFKKRFPTVQDVFRMESSMNTSDSLNGKFILPQKCKVAIALFADTDPKNIDGRMATDILYMNLMKRGYSLSETDEIKKIIQDNSLLTETKLDEKALSKTIAKLKHTDYLIIGNMDALQRSQVNINLSYYYALLYQKEYDSLCRKYNAQYAKFNKKLYPIIRKTIWPLNDEIRLHNFAVMLQVQSNSKFAEAVKNKVVLATGLKNSDILDLENHRALTFQDDSLANELDRMYPQLDQIVSTIEGLQRESVKIQEYRKLAAKYRKLAHELSLNKNADPKNIQQLLAAAAKADSDLKNIIKADQEKGQELALSGNFMSFADLLSQYYVKQLVLRSRATAKYGISLDSNAEQAFIVPYVIEYNQKVRYYNGLMGDLGISHRLYEAYACPSLIPLYPNVDLEKVIGPKTASIDVATINFTIRVFDTKTGKVKLIASGTGQNSNIITVMNMMMNRLAQRLTNK
ncbi:MAG: hypothetical protein KOO69_05050 [Victivallales bacterium]|nr:hypothetical protein [Victivallales bacterium]